MKEFLKKYAIWLVLILLVPLVRTIEENVAIRNSTIQLSNDLGRNDGDSKLLLVTISNHGYNSEG